MSLQFGEDIGRPALGLAVIDVDSADVVGCGKHFTTENGLVTADGDKGVEHGVTDAVS